MTQKAVVVKGGSSRRLIAADCSNFRRRSLAAESSIACRKQEKPKAEKALLYMQKKLL